MLLSWIQPGFTKFRPTRTYLVSMSLCNYTTHWATALRMRQPKAHAGILRGRGKMSCMGFTNRSRMNLTCCMMFICCIWNVVLHEVLHLNCSLDKKMPHRHSQPNCQKIQSCRRWLPCSQPMCLPCRNQSPWIGHPFSLWQ